MGCTDVTDAGYLLNTLRVLRLYGTVPVNGTTYQERRTPDDPRYEELDPRDDEERARQAFSEGRSAYEPELES